MSRQSVRPGHVLTALCFVGAGLGVAWFFARTRVITVSEKTLREREIYDTPSSLDRPRYGGPLRRQMLGR